MSLYDYYEKIYALEAQGKKIVKLSAGEPDWGASQEVISAVTSALTAKKDKYSSAAGIPSLRNAAAALHSATSKNVVIAPGSKWAIFQSIYVLCTPGDNIVTFAPYWGAFKLMCEKLNVEFRQVNLKLENNFAKIGRAHV